MSAQQQPQNPQQQNPTLPIENGPETAIPQTAIPHMGTSQAEVAQPTVETGVQSHAPQPQAQAQPEPQPQAAPAQAPVQMPPLPPDVTQQQIDAAIAQVEQTSTTDGISPEVMAAACAQIEARARAQGIDIAAVAQSTGQSTGAPQQQAPQHGAQTAVNDRQGTMQQFAEQRDSLRQQVAEQRDAMQQPINAALNQGQGGAAAFDPEVIAELTRAVKDLDPQTLSLINAVGQMSANPSILNTVVWIEVIRAMRRLIASEAKKQVQDMVPAPHDETGTPIPAHPAA